MPPQPDRILTTHAGSLPRPQRLRALYVRRNAGEAIDAAELAEVTAEAVRAVIKGQAEAGVDIVNDGEQQREHFFLYLQRRLTGIGSSWSRPARSDIKRYPQFQAMQREMREARAAVANSSIAPPMAIGDIKYIEPGAAAECAVLRNALDAAGAQFPGVFLTAPSPGIVMTAMANSHYPSDEAYLDALTQALAREYQIIAGAGFILQIDAPDLALERAVTFQDQPIGAFLAFVERIVAAVNRAIAGIPPQQVRLHVCWGNAEAPHDDDVPLAEISSRLREAKVGGFSLPFANPRHAHEYRLAPQLLSNPTQTIVAGVIDTTTNYIEHPEVVADRIQQVAREVGDPRRVIAGTDCGFDTAAGLGQVAPDVVWAKLAALAEGARVATRRLFT
jgi:5-methyltetrahydropteroyltriglutamate--homocysteine methyltransferase